MQSSPRTYHLYFTTVDGLAAPFSSGIADKMEAQHRRDSQGIAAVCPVQASPTDSTFGCSVVVVEFVLFLRICSTVASNSCFFSTA